MLEALAQALCGRSKSGRDARRDRCTTTYCDQWRDTLINWDDYYMTMVLWIRSRSPDQSTKHGCILVAQDHSPISMGYNGYVPGVDHDSMPKGRPEKYLITLHSEDNALWRARPSDTEGSTLYVTGEPCLQCWCKILRAKISRVVTGQVKNVCGNIGGDDPEAYKLLGLMLLGRDIVIERGWKPKLETVDEVRAMLRLMEAM